VEENIAAAALKLPDKAFQQLTAFDAPPASLR
jgi:hypothetical protein